MLEDPEKSPVLINTEESACKKVLLIAAYRGSDQRELCLEYLNELEKLADTLGYITAEKLPCNSRKFDGATYLSKGKLEEVVEVANRLEVDLVIIDDEISPSQQRNLEKIFNVPVIDRTEVILEVFAQRAKTKEAKLQIELAKVRYEMPRLKRLWTHFSRQKGGGVQSKGEGEKQIEIDRRLLKNRIERLKEELDAVKANREVQRVARARSEVPTFAIIGYTNVGKSTLLKALTQADVLVEDKLFATLDTTTRKFQLPNQQEILLIDTVGFIRKIPHTLVAAFRSTLEEALEADFLLHLVDVSHPLFEEQANTTYEVLKSLNAGQKPILTVLNKIDLCPHSSSIDRMRIKYPKTVAISATQGIGFEDLMRVMIEEIAKRRLLVTVKIPQSEYAIVSEIMRMGKILYQEYQDNDIIMKAEVPQLLAKKLEAYFQ